MLLTLLAITGTLIPQRLEAISYIQAFPKSWQFILGMGFDDMYRSHLFIAVLFLLSLSAIVCVVIRSNSTFRKLFTRLKNATHKEISALEVSKIITTTPNLDKLKGFELGTFENNSKVAFKSTGKSALLGSLILHIGLVMIFLGGLIGLIWGVEMSISGKEGEKIPIPSLKTIRAAVRADNLSRKARHIRQFNPKDPRLDTMRTEIEKLHNQYNEGIMKPEFKVAFDKLWVEHYNLKTDKQQIKSWNTEVRFLEVASGTLHSVATETQPMKIQVNYPVSYKDFGFYLASWSKNWKQLKMIVDYVPNKEGWQDYKPSANSFPQTVEIGVGEVFTIKDFPYSIVVNSFLPDFRVAEGGFFNASQELKNPAAMILAFDNKINCEVGHTWAFTKDKSSMSAHVSNLPLKFTFINANYDYESILQVAYDPGKPLVWTGCILFCLGMMFSFYVCYKEKWVVLNNDGSTLIAMKSNRSAQMLKKELDNFEKELTALQNSEGK